MIICTRPTVSKSRLRVRAPMKLRGREDREVPAGLLDVEEGRQGVAVGEEEGVVEERLTDEEREAQGRAPRVEGEDGPRDHPHADGRALADRDGVVDVAQRSVPVSSVTVLLDVAHDRLGLLLAAVDEEPPRALRHVAAHQEDPMARIPAEPEGQAPAEGGVEDGRVQQRDRQQRPTGGADPEGAIDGHVDAAAIGRRDELVDGGVDGGVLTADAGAGEEPRGEVPERVRRERRGARSRPCRPRG